MTHKRLVRYHDAARWSTCAEVQQLVAAGTEDARQQVRRQHVRYDGLGSELRHADEAPPRQRGRSA